MEPESSRMHTPERIEKFIRGFFFIDFNEDYNEVKPALEQAIVTNNEETEEIVGSIEPEFEEQVRNEGTCKNMIFRSMIRIMNEIKRKQETPKQEVIDLLSVD